MDSLGLGDDSSLFGNEMSSYPADKGAESSLSCTAPGLLTLTGGGPSYEAAVTLVEAPGPR